MRSVMVFNMISLDGYIADAKGDMGWARQQDKEWNEFTQGNAKGDGLMLFGRKTYDLMAGFWPTPAATAMMPEVAERMNSAKKVVFSRSMEGGVEEYDAGEGRSGGGGAEDEGGGRGGYGDLREWDDRSAAGGCGADR